MIRQHHRCPGRLRHVEKSWIIETLMPHLQRMPKQHAIHSIRQQFQECAKIIGIEPFGGHELPQNRPQPVAQFCYPLPGKFRDRFACLGQDLAVRAVTRGFHRKLKPIGHRLGPVGKGRGLLAAVIGRVHLGGGQMLADISQFILLTQARRIEAAAPRLIDPSANPCPDPSCHAIPPAPRQ